MLRDRCPKVVSFALKYCKAKEAWLDHVYKNWIWMYSSNQERLNATKAVLGLKNSKKPNFKFEDTILWDNLTKEEADYWKSIAGWVSWFKQSHYPIENAYRNSISCGKDIISIKKEIINDWLLDLCPTEEDDTETKNRKNKNVNELVDFLIDSFENKV